MRRIFTVTVLMTLLQFALNADAASVAVVPGANGVYYLKAYDFTEIGGVEIDIQYDMTTLANPRITQGPMLASTMFIQNPDCNESAVKTGVCSKLHNIKISAMSLSAIKGSGDLATITFDLKGIPGAVAVVRQKFVGVTGTIVKADAPPAVVTADTVVKPETPPVVVTADTGVTRGAGGGTSVSGSTSVGTITLPTDQIAAAEAGRKTDYQPLVTDLRKDMTVPPAGSDRQQSPVADQKAETGKEQPKKYVSYKSTVQLFRDYKGDKTAKAFIQLFAELSVPDFKQEPPIAFSDGKTPMIIKLVMKPTGGEPPKFLFQGANVKKLGEEGEETITWTIEAVPKKDAVDATLTVVDGQTIIDIPLTIVPRINPLLEKGKVLSENDFKAYLAKPPKFDFNNDQKFDAIDDYIYTANYIVAMKIKPEKAVKEEKKEPLKPEKKGDVNPKEPIKIKDEKLKPAEKPSVKP